MTASSALDALLRRADPADAGAQNNLGVLLHRRGRADDARAAFARALALDPAMELARRNLVATDAATGARRERELRARLRVDGADHDARRELARLLAVDGRHEAAYAELTALESLFPGDVGVLIERARVEHASGALDAAARTLARAAARAPRSATIRALLAEVTYHRGDPAGALALLGEALALAPDDADVQLLHGFVLGELGRADAANAARARAVALNPALGRADANLTVRPTGGPVHRSVSPMSAGASGTSSGAPAAAALAHPPPPADPTREDRREPPEAHLALANAFRRKGYLDEALREYRRAAAVGARPECVARALGTLHLERGAPAAAVTSWRRLVTRAPSDADAWLGLGVASHLAGDAAGARSAYARVVAALPGAVADRRVAQARTGLALLQWADGDVGHAAAALARVVSDVGLPAARVDLVTALAAAGEHARAVEAGRALVRDLPGRADAWTALGRVLAHLGRPAEARAAFARALDLAPDDVAARYGVAFAAAALGEHDLARRETERALAASALVPAPRLLLALDVDGEPAEFALAAPDVVAPGDAATDFALTAGAADALLDELLAPVPAEQRALDDAHDGEPTARSPWATADEHRRHGEYVRAAAAVHQALARGAKRDQGLARLGALFAAQGLYGEALERFAEARTLAPDSRTAALGEARALRATGRRAAAAAAARVLAAAWPDDPSCLALAAAAAADDGECDAAVELLARAAVHASAADDPVAWEEIAAASRAVGDPDREAAAWQSVVRLRGGDARARLALARALASAGRCDAAEATLCALATDAPHLADAAILRAELRARVGDGSAAIALLAGVATRDPWHADAIAALGAVLLDVGRTSDAAVAARRALRLDPEHALALAIEGGAHADAGDHQRAVSCWRRAIALEPVGAGSQRARVALRARGERP